MWLQGRRPAEVHRTSGFVTCTTCICYELIESDTTVYIPNMLRASPDLPRGRALAGEPSASSGARLEFSCLETHLEIEVSLLSEGVAGIHPVQARSAP